MAFSATDAAFEGFRVVRRTPMTIVWWALFYLVFTVLMFGLAGGSMLTMMGAAEQLQGNPTPAPEDLAPMFQAYGAFFGIIMPLAIIMGAVLYGAANRAVLKPTERNWGFMRAGMDEVRIFVVSLVLAIIGMVLLGVLVLVAGVVTGFAAASGGSGAGILTGVVAFCAVAVLAIFLSIRFCLASPITFVEKRIAIFDSWGMTKGRFWPLFGMALIALIMALIVNLLGTLVFLPLTLMFGGLGNLTEAGTTDMMELMRTMAPAIIVYVISTAVVSALQMAVIYAPFAAAYRDIRGLSTPETAEVFA